MQYLLKKVFWSVRICINVDVKFNKTLFVDYKEKWGTDIWACKTKQLQLRQQMSERVIHILLWGTLESSGAKS